MAFVKIYSSPGYARTYINTDNISYIRGNGGLFIVKFIDGSTMELGEIDVDKLVNAHQLKS